MGFMNARRLTSATLAALCAVTVALALTAAPASAKVVHNVLFSFDGSKTPAGSFSPTGIYVDNSSTPTSGDVYVGDNAHTLVDRFTPKGAYDCQITAHGSTSGTSVSLSECDSSTTGTPTGSFVSTYGEGAVDSSSGDVWLPESNGEMVDEFSPGGAYKTQLTVPEGGKPIEVAFDSSGDLFVADIANKRVDEY